MERRLIIIGPPGTGKTTALRRHAEEEFERGLRPWELQGHTFTRTARREMLRKFHEKFGFRAKDLPWFRTIHSTCFWLLGGKAVLGDRIVDGAKLREFGRKFGYEFSDPDALDEEEEAIDLMLQTIGDWYLFYHHWWRNSLYPSWEAGLRDFERRQELPPEWSRRGLERCIERYEGWKAENGYRDFSDLLLEVLRRRLAPEGVKVLLVDECQDLSPLQFKVVSLWEQGVERSYYAGDPDQSVFSFQAANPSLFLSLEGEIEFLRRSHRVPREPRDLAMRVIRPNKTRYHEEWLPRDAEGWILERVNPHRLPFDEWIREGKEVFILHRTRWLCSEFASFLLHEGLPFTSMRGKWCPWERKEGRVVCILKKLLDGATITLGELWTMVEGKFITKPFLRHGAKAGIKRKAGENPSLKLDKGKLRDLGFTDAFFSLFNDREFMEILRIPAEEKTYFRTGLRKYNWGILEKYTMRELEKREGKIGNGTIHSSKGRECDITVVNPTLTRRTYEALWNDPEEERRIMYVAVTRCYEGTVILSPGDARYFQL